MATAKKAASAKTTTALVKWDEALAARAKAAQKTEASVVTGSFISFKGGILSYAGNAVPGNALDVVVVDYVMENQFYDGAYDPNNPNAPICYAFGRDEDEMVPHEKSPQPQADSCASCPQNEWGSDPQGGRGKACKNVRRLAVIPANAVEDGVADAEMAYVKVPVTSVKGWAGYVNQCAALDKPPLAFVTEIAVTPDARSQFKVNFRAKETIEDGDAIGQLLSRAEAEEKVIGFPYQEVSHEPQARGRGNPRGQRAPAPRAAPPARRAAPAAKPPVLPARKVAAAPAPAAGKRRKF